MKLSIFTTITEPDKRGDNFSDAYACYESLADEVVVVDGKETWPKEFKWSLIGEHFQKGYKQCTGDWVLHCDVDFIFHEKDYGRIRRALLDYPSSPAVSFYKYQMYVPDRYVLKSRLLIAVNKKMYNKRITFSGSGDLCQPQLDGKDLDVNEMPQAGVPFYNYDFLLKTKEQVTDDIGRMDRAWHRHFGEWLYSKDGTEKSAYDGWLEMVLGRYESHHNKIKLSEHPAIMQDTIMNLQPNQCGYSIFGNVEPCSYFTNNDKIEL